MLLARVSVIIILLRPVRPRWLRPNYTTKFFYYLRDNQYPEGCTKDQKRNLRKYFYFASLTAPKTILPRNFITSLNRSLVFRGGPNPREGVQIRCDTGLPSSLWRHRSTEKFQSRPKMASTTSQREISRRIYGIYFFVLHR